MKKDIPGEVDLVIVGAGAAGLSAAKECDRRGISFAVIEASHRIGGRAHSEEIAPGIRFDLGCSYMHQGQINPFGPIGDELGFTVGREFGDIFSAAKCSLWRNGALRAGEERDAYWHYADRCDDAAARAAEAGRDIAIADVVDIEHEEASLYLYALAALNACDADGTSVVDYANFGSGQDWPVRESFGALIAAWGRDVPVSLNTRVDRIDWSGSGVVVETSKGTIRGRMALITASTGVLASDDIRFEPALPSWKLEAIAALPTGCANKIAVHFDRDVFGAEARGFTYTENGQDEPTGFEVNLFGDPVAVIFTGGRFSEWLERQGPNAGEDYAISRVADVFGNDCKSRVSRCIASAWASDPWTRGAYSSARPGQGHQRRELARDVDGRLFFAGEAAIDVHQATAHGAYLSGLETIERVAAALSWAT
jgi:monoamine oxidase